jgi:hypothetical protein
MSKSLPTLHSAAEGIHEVWLATSALPRFWSEHTDSVVRCWRAAGMEIPE